MAQPETSSAPSPAAVRRRSDDLPMRRKTYGLLVLALGGGFLLGLLAERAGARHGPMSAGLALMAAAALILAARRWVLQPIDRLLRAVELMQRTGRPPEPGRLPTGRGDEIGRLAEALHDMAVAGLRDRHEARRLRRTLDARVQRATRHATAHLRRQALRDPLTELGNRRFFDEHVPALFELTRAAGQPMVCMAIDLDDFKQINDEHGHAAGDRALRRLADLLRACMRESDVAVRLGGDEFALWLPGMSLRRAAELAESLRKLFAGPSGGSQPWGGLSIGLASTEHDPADLAEQLLQIADDRLYRAKQSGKGRVAVAPPPDAEPPACATTPADLRQSV